MATTVADAGGLEADFHIFGNFLYWHQSTPSLPSGGRWLIKERMKAVGVFTRDVLFCSFGQGSSLLWTHSLRPFINRPIALAHGGEEFS